jgi:hypothetical protein
VPLTEAFKVHVPLKNALRVPETNVQAPAGEALTLKATFPPDGALADTRTLSPIPKLLKPAGLRTGVLAALPEPIVNGDEDIDLGPSPIALVATTWTTYEPDATPVNTLLLVLAGVNWPTSSLV